VTWLVDAKLERVPNVYSYVLQNWVVSKLIKLPGGYRIKIWFAAKVGSGCQNTCTLLI